MHAGFSQAAFAAALADDLDGDADSTHPHVPHTPELRDSFGNTASDLGTRLWGQAFIPLDSRADSGTCSVASFSNPGTCKGPQHVGCCCEFMPLGR